MADMEMGKLPNFILILILVGLVIGVGMVVMANFSSQVLDSTTVSEENITFAENATTADFTNNNVTSIIRIGALPSANYSNDDNTITLTSAVNGTYNSSYIYGKSTVSATAVNNASDAISAIPNTWLSLIVTVAILAIILMLVIRSFGTIGRQ